MFKKYHVVQQTGPRKVCALVITKHRLDNIMTVQKPPLERHENLLLPKMTKKKTVKELNEDVIILAKRLKELEKIGDVFDKLAIVDLKELEK
jgi:hypothetical protein